MNVLPLPVSSAAMTFPCCARTKISSWYRRGSRVSLTWSSTRAISITGEKQTERAEHRLAFATRRRSRSVEEVRVYVKACSTRGLLCTHLPQHLTGTVRMTLGKNYQLCIDSMLVLHWLSREAFIVVNAANDEASLELVAVRR